MAFKTRFRPQAANRPSRSPRGYQSPLPHSSWRLAPADAGAPVIVSTASEFWSRLGL